MAQMHRRAVIDEPCLGVHNRGTLHDEFADLQRIWAGAQARRRWQTTFRPTSVSGGSTIELAGILDWQSLAAIANSRQVRYLSRGKKPLSNRRSSETWAWAAVRGKH